ncbi:hypothetical protein, partial [Bifidobacterium aquikefiri]|uniref:hypothetical protein n=1 Tax=Bifidobacterium aquikefiri TaxID=1653207 RepID=UPI0039ED7659
IATSYLGIGDIQESRGGVRGVIPEKQRYKRQTRAYSLKNEGFCRDPQVRDWWRHDGWYFCIRGCFGSDGI